MGEVSQSPESDKPANFADLNVSQQTHALCLAAQEKVSKNKIIEWIRFGKKELTDEEVSEINKAYDKLSDEISWGGKDNDKLIQDQLGVDSVSVHEVISDAYLDLIRD